MNIKRIVMSGVLVLGISHCQELAGGAEIKPYLAKNSETLTPTYTNKVTRKETYQIGIDNGQMLGAGDYDRITIHQIKNPCFFMDKDDWEYEKWVKVNNNTIRNDGVKGTVKAGDWKPTGIMNVLNDFDAKTRPDLGYNLVFHSDGKITNKLDGREVIQVLGTDKNCYLYPTVEEWTLYNKNRSGDFREAGRVKFYLK